MASAKDRFVDAWNAHIDDNGSDAVRHHDRRGTCAARKNVGERLSFSLMNSTSRTIIPKKRPESEQKRRPTN